MLQKIITFFWSQLALNYEVITSTGNCVDSIDSASPKKHECGLIWGDTCSITCWVWCFTQLLIECFFCYGF